ncbi:TNF receptor-associated factor 3 [Hondaea fermentalgiana]|uniref:TNF receptor-associated factor 3 n=1 Tax=Hondaea fermentalgiana TaxID=2315210 RepID=A0A2R5GJQ6_9STRA|nr:TNF receptor-associated factor 3 [Hondaea fermentalgiana]|eukprot:GBG31122.1 TNF receptor-associated factor 3 [Hondaea fermentalgiana]
MPVTFAPARLPAARGGGGSGGGGKSRAHGKTRSLDRRETLERDARTLDLEEQEPEFSCPDCGEDVPVRKVQEHARIACDFRIVTCKAPGCQLRVPFVDLDWHREVDCKYTRRRRRLVRSAQSHVEEMATASCKACGESFPKAKAERHAWVCQEKLVACPNVITGCLAFVKASDLDEHLAQDCKHQARRRDLACKFREMEVSGVSCEACGQQGIDVRGWRRHRENDCPMRLIQCPLGCGAKDIIWQHLEDHYEESCPRRQKRDELIKSGQAKVTTSFRCTMGCGARIPEACMPGHIKRECPNRYVQCECGHSIRIKDRALHQRTDLVYTVHRVARCIFAVRREGLASLSLARGRMPQQVACPLECGEDLTHKELQDHVRHLKLRAGDIARHEREECAGAATFRKQIENGQRRKLHETCSQACGTALPHARMRTHQKHVCAQRPVPCRLGCGQLVPWAGQEAHIRAGSCTVALQRDALAPGHELLLLAESYLLLFKIIQESGFGGTKRIKFGQKVFHVNRWTIDDLPASAVLEWIKTGGVNSRWCEETTFWQLGNALKPTQ